MVLESSSSSRVERRVDVEPPEELAPASAEAQRAFEKGGRVVYVSNSGSQTDLGVGFSPVLTAAGKVALIRGRWFYYGDDFDCRNRPTKNWIAIYDPATRIETTLFDGALSFGRDDMQFCIFQEMQLSPDGTTVYLVSPVYATSGSLAIIHLSDNAITYVPGVNSVSVIATGPHKGELVYKQRRTCRTTTRFGVDESPCYPFVHARTDGEPIRVLTGEFYDYPDQSPEVAAYLRTIGG